MSTVIQSGRDLSLTINNDSYDAQASSVLLTRTLNRERYEVLAGTRYKTNTKEGTLQVTMFTDWGETDSLCEALDDAATTAPDVALDFEFTHGSEVFAGKVFPEHPDGGGEAPEPTQVTVELTLDADTPVTRNPVGP